MDSGVLTRRLRQSGRSFRAYAAAHPFMRTLLRTAGAFAAAFVLADASVLGNSIPLSLAFLAAMPFGLPCIGAFLGASSGFVIFWGLSEALTPLAAGFLIVAELGIFRELLPRDRRWFLPLSAALLYALPGFVQLLQARLSPEPTVLFAVRTVLLGVCCRLLGGSERLRRNALALALLCALCRMRLVGELCLGAAAASCFLCLILCREEGLPHAAACGLTADLCCGAGCSLTAAFCLAALLCRLFTRRGKLLRIGTVLLCCGAFTLFFAAPDAAMFASCVLGAIAAAVLPVSLLPQTEEPAGGVSLLTQQTALGQTSDLLLQVCAMLGKPQPPDPAPQSAAVFDRAAERICRSCGKWDVCWDACAADTYRALSRAAAQILQRGRALPEDLPEAFRERCCYPDGFLSAVNEALDEQRSRRQYQLRLAESRTVLREQYRVLSRLLQSLAEPRIKPPPARFSPELGLRVCSAHCGAGGDHGCSFSCGEWYYLLLCDGMGTGAEAGRESAAAVKLLRGLICSGFDAGEALQMLNGVYVLRENGGFSTVDLLQLSLSTAEGFLFKWGAAPSYLRAGKSVEKLGTSLPPPGLGATEQYRAECLRVSLRRGEMLVLTIDGVPAAYAEYTLREHGEKEPRELASMLTACAAASPDDRTAAVLTLRQKRH